MKKYIKLITETWHLLVILLITFYVFSVSIYQRFSCPKLTETELFMDIPKNVILEFKKC